MSVPVIEALPAPLAPQPVVMGHVTPLTRELPPVAGRNLAREYANRALALGAYGLRRIGLTTVCGILGVAAAGALFFAANRPLIDSVAGLQQQLRVLHPTPGGSRNIGVPTLGALPTRADAPDVVAKILEEARASDVDLARGEYEYLPARDGVAARYRMTFPLHASYPKIRQFMDRTLVALPAVAVEGLRIERKSVGDETVDVELRLAAYLRGDE